MERPRTGHRPHHPGSITVVELLRRQHEQSGVARSQPSSQGASGSSRGCPASAAAEPTTGPFTDELVRELIGPDLAHSDGGQSVLGKAAKVLGLAAGSAMLCGSVVVASMVAHQRQTQPTAPAALSVPVDLTGVGALRPDLVSAQLDGASGPLASRGRQPRSTAQPLMTDSAPTSSTPSPVSGQQASEGRGTTAAASPSTSVATTAAPTTSHPASSTRGATAAGVVRDFYRLVATSPAAAADLVEPSLLDSDLAGFVHSWNSIDRVLISSVQANANGTVQATVSLLWPNGTWTRITELLTVTGGSNPLISGAELLYAQHG